MKTLELKHLAAYLPYLLELEIANLTKGYYLDGISKNTLIHVNHDSRLGFKCHIADVKPILRPLADLKKEPDLYLLLSFESIQEFEESEDLTLSKLFHWEFSNLCARHFDVFGLIDAGLAININYLCARHFDVFGLIDAGLAININYLNNENETIQP